jgi:hypothetical protein
MALFETFARLNKKQELEFDATCQIAIWKIIPSIANMVIAAEKYAMAIEEAILKEMEWQALGKQKKQSSSPKPPEEVFETACFSFIQCGEAMKDFMEGLPVPLGSD